MKYLFEELKAAADMKTEIAKTEVVLWQRLSRALDVIASREEKRKDKQELVHVTLVQPETASRFLNVTQAAKYLGISRSSLYKLRTDGTLNYIKIGRLSRYKIDDLDAIAIRYTRSRNPS